MLNQLNYLNAMGITVYQLRDKEQTPSWPMGYQFAAYNQAGKQVAWTLVQTEGEITQAEIDLHNAICKALNMVPDDVTDSVMLDWNALKAMPIIIVFGYAVLPPELIDNAVSLRGEVQKYYEQPYLVTESLIAMLQDPNQKKRVWQELQLVRPLI